MPKYCAVIGCQSSGLMKERKFFRFPMLNNTNSKTLAITQTRQDSWARALNRANFFPIKYKNATVCDLHFISGKSAKFTDVNDPDWVPSKSLGYEIVKNESNEEVQSNEQSNQEPTDPDVAEELNSYDGPTKEQHTQTDFPKFCVGTQTDLHQFN